MDDPNPPEHPSDDPAPATSSPPKALLIPELFWSSEQDKPFEICTVCEQDLMNLGHLYWIEKTFEGPEAVFECALCIKCHQKLQEDFSTESRDRLGEYLDERVDPRFRDEELRSISGRHIAPWISHCIATGEPASQLRDYQLLGCCAGPHLMLSFFPCLISGQAVQAMQQLISEQTRNTMNNFIERYFGVPGSANSPFLALC